jgi:lipopolysaccharide transport system permease protein
VTDVSDDLSLLAERAFRSGSEASVVLDLSDRPDTRRQWVTDLFRHRDVLLVLARKDFQTRYKRATLGIAWAVLVPLVQTTVMAVVFSRVVRGGGGSGYPIYVMSGIIAFSYFQFALTTGATSIVDGSGLSDKVWFPRVLLVVVPTLSNLPGLVITSVVLIGAMPVLGVHIGVRLLLLVPAIALLALFSLSLAIVVAAMHVYFRDVRFLVQASLMVWMYVTPIVYPIALVHRFEIPIEANPLTGVVTVFHMATVGSRGPWLVPVVVSLGVTAVLFVVGAEVQRRHDRLFVDQL